MKQEDKDLLLKDLCGRLPYGVFVECNDNDGSLPNIWKVAYINIITEELYLLNTETTATKLISVEDTKPFLFPLSSMTEEQWNNAPRVNLTEFTFESLKCGCFTIASYTCENDLCDLVELIDWLNKNHFDYRDLIPMGLANDATWLNIYYGISK